MFAVIFRYSPFCNLILRFVYFVFTYFVLSLPNVANFISCSFAPLRLSFFASASVIYILCDSESKRSRVRALQEWFEFLIYVVAVCINTISSEEIMTFSSIWVSILDM